MTTALTNEGQLPKDAKTGLTLPLRTSLGSQDLAKHKAMLGVELEVLAKKFDRFGWDRDRGSAVHDRQLQDWMNALQDFPLDEVQAACRAAVLSNPNKMPNEGHVKAEILKARARVVAMQPKPQDPPRPVIDDAKRAERSQSIAEVVKHLEAKQAQEAVK